VADVIVLGGPNGAGKTTAAPGMLAPQLGIREFVNADEIASGISPLNPEGSEIAAGRLLLERIHALADLGESFGFETTCAGRGHARLLRRCRSTGYRVTLIFLWLPTPDMAIARVDRRIAAGGHGVDAAVVVRRYWAGLRNLRHLYLPLSDFGYIYDNSDDSPVLVAESAGQAFVIRESARWQMIEEATQ
jgi:predicted ABC-type ATPase